MLEVFRNCWCRSKSSGCVWTLRKRRGISRETKQKSSDIMSELFYVSCKSKKHEKSIIWIEQISWTMKRKKIIEVKKFRIQKKCKIHEREGKKYRIYSTWILYKKHEKTKKKCLHRNFKSDNIITSRRRVEWHQKRIMKFLKKDVDTKNCSW